VEGLDPEFSDESVKILDLEKAQQVPSRGQCCDLGNIFAGKSGVFHSTSRLGNYLIIHHWLLKYFIPIIDYNIGFQEKSHFFRILSTG
jgi:hypothetical protein